MSFSYFSKFLLLSVLCCSIAHAQDIQLPYSSPVNKCEREANALVILAEKVNTCDNATDWYKRYLKLFRDCPAMVKATDKLYYKANEQVRNVSLFQCSSDVHHKIQEQILGEDERYEQKERHTSKDGLTTEEREERDEDALEARRKVQTERNLKIFDVDDEALFLKFTNEVLYLFELNGYKLQHISEPERINSFNDNSNTSSNYKFRSISLTLHFDNDMKIDVAWEYSNTEGDKKQIFIYPKNVKDFQELVQRRPYQKIANLVNEKQDLSEAKSLTGVYLILINNPVVSRLQYESKEINPILKARFEGKPMPRQTESRNQIPRYIPHSPATNTEPASIIAENQESKGVVPSAKLNTEESVAKTVQKADSPNKNATTPTAASLPVVAANLTTVETVVKLKECFGNTIRAEIFEKGTNRKIGLIIFGNLKEGENKYEILLDANKYHQEGKVYGMYTTEQLKFISSIETPNPFYFINGTFLASELRFKHKDSNGQIVSYYINKINLNCE